MSIFLMAAGLLHVQTSQSLAATNDEDSPLHLQLDQSEASVQPHGLGHGFSGQTSSLSVEAGAGVGFKILGSRGNHDVALMSLAYGHMLGGVRGQGWYRGNWEVRGEMFGGSQFYPQADWLAGAAAHLRYNFATGTRWVPFVDGGAGAGGTGIGEPDLGGTFQFNEQATVGMHYFFRENFALTAEARFMHISCAGIEEPNNGVNLVLGFIGVSWLF